MSHTLKPISLALAAGFAASFVACGDETSETIVQKSQSTMDIAESLDDLPDCDDSNEGSQVWIKDDGSTRYCLDGKWEAYENSVTVGDYSCHSELLSDSTGLKIVCNGDSIGVVLNGENGKDGEKGAKGDDGKKGEDGKTTVIESDCNIISKNDTSVVVKCGTEDPFEMKLAIHSSQEESSSSLASSSSSESSNISEEEETECNEVEESDGSVSCYAVVADISGESQKGPFLRGANVDAYELLNGRTLKQTGKTFHGSIDADNGIFNIKSIKLSSQYSYIEASGSYLNEITGTESDGPIQLRTLTNLKGRKKANINLLTHLEYNRVVYLVTKEKMGVAAAKRQALREILTIFNIDTSSLDNSTYAEDLTVFGSKEADAALLAISVLLQGEHSAADLKALLAGFSSDIAESGLWYDLETKDSITRWAFERVVINDSLPKYHQNVANWKLSDKVPDFEKHVRRFVGIQSGLGVCDESSSSVPVGTVHNVSNDGLPAYSTTKYNGDADETTERFICADKDADGNKFSTPRWRPATTIEKDTAAWSTVNANYNNGKIQKGRVTDTLYIYEAANKKWRPASIQEYDNFNYKDSLTWVDTTDGSFKIGEKTGTVYVFDKQVGWRHPTSSIDYENGIDGCTAERAQANYKARSQIENDSNIYNCVNEENVYAWKIETDEFTNDTYGEKCSVDGAIINGKVIKSNKYVCEKENVLRNAKALEVKIGLGCVDGITSHVYDYNKTTWKCNNQEWEWDKKVVASSITDKRGDTEKTYSTVAIGTQEWMSQNLNLKVGNSFCAGTDEISQECDETYGRVYSWGAAMDSLGIYSATGEGCGFQEGCFAQGIVRGICPEGWHLPSFEELNLLVETVGFETSAKSLKSSSGWKNDGNGENKYLFAAYPTGEIYFDENDWEIYFDNISSKAYFWANVISYDDVYVLALSSEESFANVDLLPANYYAAIRCIKD